MRQVPWLPAKIHFEGGFTPVLFDSVSLNGHLCLMALLAVNDIQIYTETRIVVKAGCDRLLHSSIEGEGRTVYKNNAFSSISLLPIILPLLSSLSDILRSSIVICDVLTWSIYSRTKCNKSHLSEHSIQPGMQYMAQPIAYRSSTSFNNVITKSSTLPIDTVKVAEMKSRVGQSTLSWRL
jgi:hypothetical protein